MDKTTQNKILQVKQRFTIIGNSPALTSAIERALQVAPIDLSVLVIGESGSGKESFPKIIHDNSMRKHNKYIAVNCGAIPEGTIDSELFGHEKGAFTGAISAHKGYFEEANGGTIFLDEVAELPLTTQARLLRVLEGGEYLKVGSSTVQKTNIRIVAATNKDMVEEVKKGKFREDLYYRLSTVQINVPPLRDRGDDVWLLTRKFTNDFAEKWRTDPVTYDESGRAAIMGFRWPGNVRQLKNVVEQIALFESGNTVDANVVRRYLPINTENLKPALREEVKFDYTRERELLFKLIFQLQQEIKNMKDSLENISAGNLSHQSRHGHFSSNVMELKRSPAPMMQVPTSDIMDDNFSEPDITFQDGESTIVSSNERHDASEVQAMPVDEGFSPAKTLKATERETIVRALERNGGVRNRTAKELNISERTLYIKIKEYGL
ncbi:MAG: sigma-54-dependent Fis family transcriptional regulator [Muribaculaceae bacterium]|nr:sigma-54-dependent Fis family transcriptional regulator [Muribaculaceae bacterium]